MTSFVVLTSAPDRIAAIKRVYPNDHFMFTEGQWFVVDDGVTAREVYGKLVMNPETIQESSSTAVVCAISGYFGLARKDLWEWLAAKGDTTKHGTST